MTETIIIYKTIYKTYTPAVKRAQQKYFKTEKGILSKRRARKNFYERNKEKLKVRVLCPHCEKKYSGHYIKYHIRKTHKG